MHTAFTQNSAPHSHGHPPCRSFSSRCRIHDRLTQPCSSSGPFCSLTQNAFSHVRNSELYRLCGIRSSSWMPSLSSKIYDFGPISHSVELALARLILWHMRSHILGHCLFRSHVGERDLLVVVHCVPVQCLLDGSLRCPSSAVSLTALRSIPSSSRLRSRQPTCTPRPSCPESPRECAALGKRSRLLAQGSTCSRSTTGSSCDHVGFHRTRVFQMLWTLQHLRVLRNLLVHSARSPFSRISREFIFRKTEGVRSLGALDSLDLWNLKDFLNDLHLRNLHNLDDWHGWFQEKRDV